MEYHILPADEGSPPTGREHNAKTKQHTWHPHSILLTLLMMAIFGVIISLAIYNYLHVNISQSVAETCGTSSHEAVSLGCEFDVMSFAWLPPRCFDQSLMLEFLALRDWQWYLDAESHQRVDMVPVSKGSYDHLYVTQEYHMYHCTYMWRKMHRAIQNGQPLDGYIGKIEHTAHCEKMLVGSALALNLTNTLIFSKFVECPSEGQSLEDVGWYRVVGGQRVVGFGDH